MPYQLFYRSMVVVFIVSLALKAFDRGLAWNNENARGDTRRKLYRTSPGLPLSDELLIAPRNSLETPANYYDDTVLLYKVA